ncbi:sorbitol dehydrogenase family protein [Kozakia baliensis]|uniref:sorbitol dehydrogenase family protein n=1 Tax=Kozakia baliensis TaxID=153496 RepID=UPI00345BFC3D
MARDNHHSPADLHRSSPNAMRMNRLMRMTRRDALLMGMGTIAAYGIAGAASAGSAADPGIEQFMEVSRCLTDRSQLDPRIGAALYAGFIHATQERKAQISKLYDLLKNDRSATASEFAKAAEQTDSSLKDAIHDIMTGWYRGVADGKVVVYRSALMFDITKDAIFPKTYAAGGPFYWTTKPPEVARPTGLPALSPSSFVVEPT